MALGGALLCAAALGVWAGGGSGFKPGKDGWLTLFDGSDKAKWQSGLGAEWAVKDGLLVGSSGEMFNYWHWQDFEARLVCRGSDTLRFRVSLAPMPDQAGYALDLSDGTLRTAGGEVLAKGTAEEADGWKTVTLTASEGRFTAQFDGKTVAQASDDRYPAKGYLAFVPDEDGLAVKSLRVRPLGREEYQNIPSPNSSCYVCHANFDGEPISKMHLANDIACADCHGPSLAHRSDEDNVTTPDVMFTRGEVDAACLSCHERHKAMDKKKDGEGKPPENAVCTDCHGKHEARN